MRYQNNYRPFEQNTHPKDQERNTHPLSRRNQNFNHHKNSKAPNRQSYRQNFQPIQTVQIEIGASTGLKAHCFLEVLTRSTEPKNMPEWFRTFEAVHTNNQ